MARTKRTPEQFAIAFWARTKLAANGCIEWQGSVNSDGYGSIGRDGHTIGTHRIAYELTNGIIAPGLMVLHSCDNRRCVNALHLSLGTNSDNMADMVQKGRARNANIDKPCCIRGHAFTESNTYISPKGIRLCRTCKQMRRNVRPLDSVKKYL